MSLADVLGTLCPTSSTQVDDCDLCLECQDGCTIPCHAFVLRARCPSLAVANVVQVSEVSEVVYALLQWVYLEQLDVTQGGADSQEWRHRVWRLGQLWGLRDSDALQCRLAGSRRVGREGGTVAQDVLRGYAAGDFAGGVVFCAATEKGTSTTSALPAWPTLLRHRSTYFSAMLSGSWSENAGGSREAPIEVCWPPAEFQYLMRYLHGAPLELQHDSLRAIVDLASFFGVSSLLVEVASWIASHLEPQTASALWHFLDTEPALQALEGCDDLTYEVDPDTACFEYHVENFVALALPERASDSEKGVAPPPPLFNLSIPLMHRLLSCGRISMSTQPLLDLVANFVRSQCDDPVECVAHLEKMRPPSVLFNRRMRSVLVGSAVATIESVW